LNAEETKKTFEHTLPFAAKLPHLMEAWLRQALAAVQTGRRSVAIT